jgi:hypothetical protein
MENHQHRIETVEKLMGRGGKSKAFWIILCITLPSTLVIILMFFVGLSFLVAQATTSQTYQIIGWTLVGVSGLIGTLIILCLSVIILGKNYIKSTFLDRWQSKIYDIETRMNV